MHESPIDLSTVSAYVYEALEEENETLRARLDRAKADVGQLLEEKARLLDLSNSLRAQVRSLKRADRSSPPQHLTSSEESLPSSRGAVAGGDAPTVPPPWPSRESGGAGAGVKASRQFQAREGDEGGDVAFHQQTRGRLHSIDELESTGQSNPLVDADRQQSGRLVLPRMQSRPGTAVSMVSSLPNDDMQDVWRLLEDGPDSLRASPEPTSAAGLDKDRPKQHPFSKQSHLQASSLGLEGRMPPSKPDSAANIGAQASSVCF